MIQGSVSLSQLVLNSSDFFRLSHKVFIKLSKPYFFHCLLHGAGHEIQISYSCEDAYRIFLYYHIYGNYSLELGEDVDLFVWCKIFA